MDARIKSSLEDLIGLINVLVKRVRWTNKEIDEKFSKRTISQILKERNTFYMNPCLDLSLVIGYFLGLRGYNPKLVVEELTPTKRYPFIHLHFAVDFDPYGSIHTIDFVTKNSVELGVGGYKPKEGAIQNVRVDKNFNPNNGVRDMVGNLTDRLDGFDLRKQIKRLKRENTDKRYLEYLRYLKERPHLYLCNGS